MAALAIALSAAAPAASAANRIYWTNVDDNTISFANLDGSGGFGNLVTRATIDGPEGVAIDPATGKIYWANSDAAGTGAGGISFSNLDGSGGGQLNTRGATTNFPFGVAIDPAAGQIYWANAGAGVGGSPGISFARLDGSGGGDLNTAGTTVNHPQGVAIDPAAGKIFWANPLANKISFAFLDGSGGGDLSAAGVTVTDPAGPAIDPTSKKIYWADVSGDAIQFANVNGFGGGILNTGDATVFLPGGVTVDPVAGKIYWANRANGQVSFANLDGSGGKDLNITGSQSMNASTPALFEGPVATATPTITGDSSPPTRLGCTQGMWGPDLRESLLYRAPQTFGFRWFRNGSPIAGATGSLLAVDSAGSYTCRVTAQNFVGSAVQTSAPFAVTPPPLPPPPPPPPTVSASASASGLTASVTLTCHGFRGQTCAGTMLLAASGPSDTGKRAHAPNAATVGTGSYRVAAGSSELVRITLNATGRKLLARFLRLPVTLTLPGTSTAPHTVTFRFARIRVSRQLLVWRIVLGSYTSAFSLALKPVPVGGTVKVSCRGGGCPFGQRKVKARKSHVSVTGLFGSSKLRPGTRVTFAITAKNHIGEVLSYQLLARPTIDKPTIRCLPPGSGHAIKC